MICNIIIIIISIICVFSIFTVWFLHDANPAGPSERICVTGISSADVDGHHYAVFGRLVQHLELRVTLVPVDVHFFD